MRSKIQADLINKSNEQMVASEYKNTGVHFTNYWSTIETDIKYLNHRIDTKENWKKAIIIRKFTEDK